MGRADHVKSGAPETIRTSDLPLRRRLLYPTELPGRHSQMRLDNRRSQLASGWHG